MNRPTISETTRIYDKAYQQDNYFRCRQWLYRPYVKALISLMGLKKGATVLDAGCGQGAFTDLLAKEGMSVFGVDISEVGIRKAKEKYPELADRFFVFDLNNPIGMPSVDCIFIRCCSLYNIQSLTESSSPTAGLIQLLPPGGVLLFAYSSNLSRRGKTWINHDLAEVRRHFAQFHSDHETYFINKIDTFALGRLSFNGMFTAINQLASKLTGMNGDIIVMARKA